MEVADPDTIRSRTRTAYLGPRTSVKLVQHLLTNMTYNAQLSGHLLPNELFHLAGVQDSRPPPLFIVTSDQRKIELHILVPPSTQRAIIENYLKIVAPEFTLLSTEHEQGLLTHENPLKWISSNKDDPAAYTMTMVFAISAALITRDTDSNLADVALRSRDEVQKFSLSDTLQYHRLAETRRVCAALLALALCEMISPTSGQVWDLLGRAAFTMQDLQEACLQDLRDLDENDRRLERALLKLETYGSQSHHRQSVMR